MVMQSISLIDVLADIPDFRQSKAEDIPWIIEDCASLR